jgi:hypothetical protein
MAGGALHGATHKINLWTAPAAAYWLPVGTAQNSV